MVKRTMDADRDTAAPGLAPERTHTRRVFTPRVDILETEKDIVLVADMPGVTEKTVTVTLDNNTLRVQGSVHDTVPAHYTLTQQEYEIGDFERTFSLAETIDRERIQARVRNGVLRVTLPKALPQAKRIEVKAG